MAKSSSSSRGGGKSGGGTKTINRSSKSGEFVTKDYAKKHPSTTETERRPTGRKPSK